MVQQVNWHVLPRSLCLLLMGMESVGVASWSMICDFRMLFFFKKVARLEVKCTPCTRAADDQLNISLTEQMNFTYRGGNTRSWRSAACPWQGSNAWIESSQKRFVNPLTSFIWKFSEQQSSSSNRKLNPKRERGPKRGMSSFPTNAIELEHLSVQNCVTRWTGQGVWSGVMEK